MAQHFIQDSRLLYHAAFRGQIPKKNRKAALFMVRVGG